MNGLTPWKTRTASRWKHRCLIYRISCGCETLADRATIFRPQNLNLPNSGGFSSAGYATDTYLPISPATASKLSSFQTRTRRFHRSPPALPYERAFRTKWCLALRLQIVFCARRSSFVERLRSATRAPSPRSLGRFVRSC